MPTFVIGKLGHIGVAENKQNEKQVLQSFSQVTFLFYTPSNLSISFFSAVKNAAAGALGDILKEHFGGQGHETLKAKSAYYDLSGTAHVRVVEEINGF